VLQIAPSGYSRHAAQKRTPELRFARAKQDAALLPQIHQVWQNNMQFYGAEKVWHQLNRGGIAVARCTVERLMRYAGLRGVRGGKVVPATVGDRAVPCPLDRVVQGRPAQTVMGVGLHVRLDLARLAIRGLCD
jgi:putative transposase